MGEDRDAFVFHTLTSLSDPLGPRRVETFWNRGHGLTTVVPWSVPAFLPGSASADTSLFRSCARNPKASLWKGVISHEEKGILRRNPLPLSVIWNPKNGQKHKVCRKDESDRSLQAS